MTKAARFPLAFLVLGFAVVAFFQPREVECGCTTNIDHEVGLTSAGTFDCVYELSSYCDKCTSGGEVTCLDEVPDGECTQIEIPPA